MRDPKITPTPRKRKGAKAAPVAESAASGPLATDSAAAIAFLKHLYPAGPWALTAIVPDGPTTTETFGPDSEAAASNFILTHNAKKNIYYTLNVVDKAVNKKPTKKEIKAAAYLHVDADPADNETPEAFKARFLPKLKEATQRPTAVVDSGNGIQLLWRLGTPIEINGKPIIDDIEARNVGLLSTWGASRGTQNVDRLLRLPGTINYPNAKKKKDGRVPCPATLLGFNDSVYALEAFEPYGEKQKQATPKKSEQARAELPPQLVTMLHVADSGGYPTRSELLFAFIRLALQKGISEDNIIAACLDEANFGMAIFEHVQDNRGEDYVKRQIEHALEYDEPAPDDAKQIIRITGDNRHDVVQATEHALIRAHRPVFYRGGSLVEPLWRWEKSAEKNRDTLVAKFVKLNVSRLSYMTGKHAARFQRYDKRSKSWDSINPPKEVIEMLLDLGQWSFPTVVGIINSPTMRSDGSLITEPGYDAQTQLWHKPAGDLELPSIPNSEAALSLLTDLLAGFPFKEDDKVSLCVALCAMLTPVLRGAFHIAPLFLFLAPESGTGKSYLTNVISTIATGRVPMAIVGCANKEEMDKRLSAAAFEAMPIWHLNNLSFDLESDLLCQIVTEGIVGIRPFGRNDQLISCDCRGATALANGNNIHVVGDLVRRTLTSNLDARMENPETRSFDFDPMELVKSDRGKYLAAIFKIVRDYMAAGGPKPKDALPFAGFDDWSKMVRFPLMMLGLPDPVLSMADARALDPKREVVRGLISALLKYVGVGKEFTSAQIATLAVEIDHADFRRFRRADLFESLSRDGRTVSAISVGRQLGVLLDRMWNGYRVERIKDEREHHRFMLVDTQGRTAEPTADPKGEEEL
jgi:hypothetical protein